MEFKKLSTVDSVNKPSEKAHILIEEDGVIKKAPKSAVGGKKELVYEWNPGIDADGNPVTDVFEVVENLEDDLSWLTTKSNDYGFEIIATHYCVDGAIDDEGNYTVLSDTTMTASFDDNYNYMTFFKNLPGLPVEDGTCLVAWMESDGLDINDLRNRVYAYINIYNGLQMDLETGEPIIAENGGVIMYAADNDCPIKSIKIYKITY